MDFNIFTFLIILIAIFLLVGAGSIVYWVTTYALQEQDE